jgi:hypothetical protein
MSDRMSAFGGKADAGVKGLNFCFCPLADIDIDLAVLHNGQLFPVDETRRAISRQSK